MNADRGSVRILYIEDDVGLGRLLQKRLRLHDYVVDLATDGEQGMAMCGSGSYHLLLVDHRMPGHSGLDVIRILRAGGVLPPTIMVTGAGDEKIAVEAIKLGASDYVVKDTAGGYLELLPSVVERALANHKMLLEKQQAEAALRDREELLRLITDALPACISYVDAEQIYRFNNKTYEKWFGKPVDEIMGKHIRHIWGDKAYRKAEQSLGEVMSGKQVAQEDSLTFHDGTTRHVSIVRVPHFNQQREVKGLVALVSDITDRKQAEEELQKAHDHLEHRVEQRTTELAAANAQLRQEIRERERVETELRESEERFRAIFETAQDCIFVKDRSLCYTQVNPAMEKLFGVPASDIIGTTGTLLLGEQACKQLEEVERRVLQGEFVEQSNVRVVRGIPVTLHEIRVPLRNRSGDIIGLCGISRDATGLKRPEPEPYMGGGEFRSAAMRSTLAKALLAAETDSMILLLGESGSGKDFLARYVHDNSRRAGGPFFSVNCAAVSPDLAESELFGHESGAFTSASGRKRGLLELAEGGTLLLNEIGELPLRLQAKLLTFLDTRSFTRVGGETNIRVNARLVAATNRDLDREVSEGRFRQDLFYRINVFAITVPPLRERLEDLPLLVGKIVEQLAAEMQLQQVPVVDNNTLRTLAGYNWPGNVRELRNVLERALILSGRHNHIVIGSLGEQELDTREATDWSYSVTLSTGRSINDVADDVKRALISEALNRCSGSKQDAAEMLGISRYSLFRMMKSLDLNVR